MEPFEQTESKSRPQPPPKIQKIKMFGLTQRNFAAVGITPTLVVQSYPFNDKNLLVFIILSLSVIFILFIIIN